MTVPPDAPDETEYARLQCPNCNFFYNLKQLEVDLSGDEPEYYCPRCHTLVYEAGQTSHR